MQLLSQFHLSFIQFIITSFIFYIEAIIHYNIGKFGHIAFRMPSLNQNLLMICIIMVFSFISSCITYFIGKFLTTPL